MKTKIFTGIALVLFFICLLVIYSAGFTQDYMLKKQAENLAILSRDSTTSCNFSEIELLFTNDVPLDVITTTTTNSTTVTKNTTTTTTKPVTVTPTPTPKPKPKPVTRAS
jgi:hypothetical protein